jgi:DNA replication protein DnaC
VVAAGNQQPLDLLRELARLQDRYHAHSTILTCQLPVAGWHAQIDDPALADGIVDRLAHNAHRIEMRGDSTRKIRAKSA